MSNPIRLSSTQLFLQDGTINLDDLTELDDASIFSLESMPVLPYEKDYNAQADVTIEVNPNLRVVARDMYTFLDLLSDIGGMQGILISGMAYALAFWNFNQFDNFMVSRLFKLQKPPAEQRTDMKRNERSDFMVPPRLYNPKEYCMNLVPKCFCRCKFCKYNRLETGFERARE